MGLLYSCSHCGNPIDWMNAPPPWCAKCGADFKPDVDPLPRTLSPQSISSERIPLTAPPPAPRPLPSPPPAPEPPPPGPQTVMGAPLWPKGSAGWGFLVALFLIATVGPLLGRWYLRWNTLATFDEKRDFWLAEPARWEPGSAYITGKLLPFRRKGSDGRVTDKELFKGLPEELKPKDPEEVGTVAWIDWDYEEITTPRRAWQFYYVLGRRHAVMVTLIDIKQNKKLAALKFVGSDPTVAGPNGRMSGKDHYGSKPYPEILDYLTRLPRR